MKHFRYLNRIHPFYKLSGSLSYILCFTNYIFLRDNPKYTLTGSFRLSLPFSLLKSILSNRNWSRGPRFLIHRLLIWKLWVLGLSFWALGPRSWVTCPGSQVLRPHFRLCMPLWKYISRMKPYFILHKWNVNNE